MTHLSSVTSLQRVALPVVVRFAGAGAQIGVQIAAARLLGLWALAVYGTALAWTRVAGNAVAQGYPIQVLRDGARLNAAIGLNLAMIMRRIALGTVGLAAAGFLALPVLLRSLPFGSPTLVLCIVLSAGSYAVLRCGSERSKAAGGAVSSLFFEFVVPPLVVLVTLLALIGSSQSSGAVALVALTLPLGYSIASAALLLDSGRRFDRIARHDPPFEIRLATIGVLNPALGAIPLLLAPAFVSVDEVAWLAASLRLVAAPTLVFAGLAAFFAPHFSAAAARSDTERLRLLFRQSRALAVAVYLPAAAVLLAVPQTILGLFSIHSDGAATILRLLVVAQASNAVTGLSSEFLTMANGEAQEFRATAIGAASSVVLVSGGGFLMGVTGIAIGFGASLAIRFTLSWWAIRKTLAKGQSVIALSSARGALA